MLQVRDHRSRLEARASDALASGVADIVGRVAGKLFTGNVVLGVKTADRKEDCDGRGPGSGYLLRGGGLGWKFQWPLELMLQVTQLQSVTLFQMKLQSISR